jgi:hypothetical protein
MLLCSVGWVCCAGGGGGEIVQILPGRGACSLLLRGITVMSSHACILPYIHQSAC